VTPSPRSRWRALLSTAALALATAVTVLTPLPPAQAVDTETSGGTTSGYLCTGYGGCAGAGYSHFGYRAASDQMWWRMYSGHNCTNYVAYRLVKNGMSAERPWDSTGMAYNWGRANRSITDEKPMVGAVAWWEAGDGVGSSGHVAYVQKVLSSRKIVISEDSWGGDFHWRTLTRRGGSWPTGFVHFQDRSVTVESRPSITGTPRVGQTLTAVTGTWKPAATKAVQWYAAGDPIDGATGTTLTVTKALLRARLSVRVVATARGYLPGRSTSERTERVRSGLMDVATRPTISGRPRVDEVLTVDPGAATPASDSREVRWFADGERIAGADNLRLRIGQDLIGTTVTAVVVHRRDGYHALEATSAATDRIEAGRFEVSEPFTMSGRPRVGRTLSVTPGTFTPADATVRYTWLRGDEVVTGATGRSYEVTGTDLGQPLSVRVDLTHPGYRDESLVLDTDATVTTVPTVRVDAEGLARRAVVKLRVTAPGIDDVGGRATVRIAGREVTGRVVDGRLRVVVTDLDPGRHTVRVSYDGTRLVEAARATDRVRVTRR
jgi:surface antigen